MATTGGSGTLRPPGDDDVAPVIPLRKRQPQIPAPARARLPRERAAFDPELEPGEVLLRRHRRHRIARRVAAVGGRAWSDAPPTAAPRLLVGAGIARAIGMLIIQPFSGASRTGSSRSGPTAAAAVLDAARAV